jgi:hypothetical protein
MFAYFYSSHCKFKPYTVWSKYSCGADWPTPEAAAQLQEQSSPFTGSEAKAANRELSHLA